MFHDAIAYVKDNKVILFYGKVPSPITVHFSWIGDDTESNLFNKGGFPSVLLKRMNGK